MTFDERVLYHQVHPLKLLADISTAVASLWLLAEHRVLLGLVIMLLPPALVSAIVISTGDLESIKNSEVGRYLLQYMTSAATALRLTGMLIMSVGAWHRQWLWVLAGLSVVVYAWTRGLIRIPGRGKR